MTEKILLTDAETVRKQLTPLTTRRPSRRSENSPERDDDCNQ